MGQVSWLYNPYSFADSNFLTDRQTDTVLVTIIGNPEAFRLKIAWPILTEVLRTAMDRGNICYIYEVKCERSVIKIGAFISFYDALVDFTIHAFVVCS